VQRKFDQVPACNEVRRNQKERVDDAYAINLIAKVAKQARKAIGGHPNSGLPALIEGRLA